MNYGILLFEKKLIEFTFLKFCKWISSSSNYVCQILQETNINTAHRAIWKTKLMSGAKECLIWFDVVK